MENINARKTKYYFIIILLLFTIVASLFTATNIAYAQNSDIKIPLSNDSKFDVCGEIMAYTNGKSFSIAKDNHIYSMENTFDTALDIEISYKKVDGNIEGYYIAVLNSDHTVLPFYFDNTTNILNKIKSFENDDISLYKNVNNIYSDNNNIYVMRDKSINNVMRKPSSVAYILDDFKFDFVDFVVINGYKTYALNSNGEIFTFDADEVTKAAYDNAKINIPMKADAITAINDTIYFSSNNKLMKFNTKGTLVVTENGKFDGENKADKIDYSIINDKTYIFELSLSDLSIKQYELTNNSLDYVNTYNNKEYQHPTQNKIVKIAKAKNEIIVYMSPITRLSVFNLAKDDLVLVLDEQDGYYYVTDAKGKFGYINKTSDSDNLLFIEPQINTKIGKEAQVLHPGTKMYALPFDTSTVLKTFSQEELQTRLAVEYCLACEGTNDIWGWYKLSFMDGDNKVVGYIKSNELSPYTSFTAPTVKKSVKIKADSFGEIVKVYTLADEESPILVELVDGSEVLLVEKFNADSTWTKVQYGDDLGYVKTANIQLKGLTSVQIFVITIVTLVVVATIIIVIIFCIKRKHNSR